MLARYSLIKISFKKHYYFYITCSLKNFNILGNYLRSELFFFHGKTKKKLIASASFEFFFSGSYPSVFDAIIRVRLMKNSFSLIKKK